MNTHVLTTLEDFKTAESYWLGHLSGELHEIKLVPDFPGTGPYAAAECPITLSHEMTRQLMRIGKNNRLSLYILLLAFYKLLLFKYTQQPDISTASPVYNANNRKYNKYIVFRDFLEPSMTFKELLMKIKHTVEEGYKNEHYPFIHLNDRLTAYQDNLSLLSRHVVVLENIHPGESLRDVQEDLVPDVLFTARETNGNLEAAFIYNSTLYRQTAARQLADSFLYILNQGLSDPGRRIGDIPLMTEERKHDMLYRFNDTQKEYPQRHMTLHGLFEQQVQRTPEATAVGSTLEIKNIYDQFKPEKVTIELSFRELNDQADQMARALRAMGLRVNGMVGVMIRHPLELVVTLWGILKAGSAYLPIDPAYPRDMKTYILEDSRVLFLVTEEALSDELPDLPPRVRVIFTDECQLEDTAPFKPEIPAPPPDLASIIYTSGTTGRPKGVLISHEGIVNYTLWRLETYDYRETDVTLQPLSYSFDGFGSNFYSSLLCGGMLVMVPEDKRTDVEYLKEAVLENRVTNVSLVPTIYRLLLDIMDGEALQNLRLVVLAGEKSDENLIKRSREKAAHILLVNEYGPTETTITATSQLPLEASNPALIGAPIWNKQVYILDRWLKPVPMTFPGELYVAGSGIARGYLNNMELTAERFVGFHRSYRSYISYRTGDLGRWLPDGNIEFLGRIDHQVKIRGHRIEMEAIEAQLLQHKSIKEGAAAVREDEDNKYICAYIVPHAQERFSVSGLRDYLSERLAYYMVPSRFVTLPKLPLTPGGKVDRKALPPPDAAQTGDQYIPPATEMEKQLVEIWTDVLDVEKEKIDVHTNFFQLGGHSLKATQLVSEILKKLEVKIPQAQIFKSPTVNGLVQFITASGQAVKETFQVIPAVEKKEFYSLSSAQLRIYILQQMKPGHTAYNMPFARLLEKKPDTKRLEQTFRQLIQRHESLRSSFCLVQGQVVQRVHDTVDFLIEYYDLKENYKLQITKKDKPAASSVENFIRPFDLSRAPLLRLGLVKIEAEKVILMVDMHHIISDGISHLVLVQDFTALYNGRQFPPLKLQYKAYAQWQEQFFQSKAFKQQEKYWLEHLKGDIPRLHMPLDFKRPPRQSFEGQTIPFTIPHPVSERLNRLANEQNVSLNILVLSLYTLLLNKYTGRQDIIVGSLAAGRDHPDLEKIIGMFANFLPIRNKVDIHHTFIEFLQAAKKNILEAYKNQDYPFEKLIDLLDLQVDLSRNALFDTMVVFHSQSEGAGMEQAKQDQLISIPYALKDRTAALDFKLDVSLTDPEALRCRLQYDAQLFKEETMNRFIGHFKHLVTRILEDPRQKVSDIRLFSTAEKKELEEKRKLNRISAGKEVKLALSTTFTADPAGEYIKWWGSRFNLDIETTIAPYNQVFQQLLDTNSLLYTHRGINGLLIRFEDWIRDFPGTPSHKAARERLEKDFNQLVEIFTSKPKPFPYLVGIFPVSSRHTFDADLTRYLEELNKRWKTAAAALANVYVLDFTPLKDLYNVQEVFDPITDKEGHLPFTTAYYAAVGTAIARAVCALNNHPFKVIALDCDNTLWQGICGEDGALGVRVEGPYLELQKFMLQKYNQGMLLILCSKNNEVDVWEVFEKNPGMLLKKEHFVDWKINWEPKSRNLEALAHQLNLGIDSFILVDDSPVECSEVMTHQPQVLTLQLPENPVYIPLFLEHVWAFDKLKVTKEDRQRSRMYRAEQKRWESQAKSISLKDFLASLELKMSMNPMKPSQVSRVSQLTQRTNQFNLSTRRRTEEEITALNRQPGTKCWVIEVSDRFGDYGLVGVVITQEQHRELFIDTLLLSCRVLGRNVEAAVLVGLGNYCRGRGLKSLRADYYPTAKNKPILAFLQALWTHTPPTDTSPAYTVYTQAVEKIPGSVEHVDFFYLHTFKKDQDQPLPAPHTLPARQGQGNDMPEPENQWEINRINSEQLLHRNHLLPLEYSTAARLCRLPLRQQPGDRRRIKQVKYEPPRDRVEEKLLDIWSRLLGIPGDSIGTAAGFFDLGGSSLGIITLLSEINRTFGVEIPVERLFLNIKIKEISTYIKDVKEKKVGFPGEKSLAALVMLLNAPKPRCLFLFPPIVGYGIGYRAMAATIDSASLYAFNYIEAEDKIQQYAAHITAVQAKGPYVTGGYSAGGNLAFEVAAELENQGYDVAAVILLDAFAKDFIFSHGTAEENHSFQQMVKEAMESFGLAFLKQEVVAKLKHYSLFYNQLVNRGGLNAPIYSITAANHQQREHEIIAKETGKPGSRQFPPWDQYTRQSCHIYKGFGTHVDMFNPGFVEKNAEIVQKILITIGGSP